MPYESQCQSSISRLDSIWLCYGPRLFCYSFVLYDVFDCLHINNQETQICRSKIVENFRKQFQNIQIYRMKCIFAVAPLLATGINLMGKFMISEIY